MLFVSPVSIFTPDTASAVGVKGADVGWLSQMESQGWKFYNDAGTQMDCLDVLKTHSIAAIRLRVWVNPSGGWCGQTDVVNMAKRVKAKGLSLMVDFHYADSWCDPGQQPKPAAWANHTTSQLYTDIYNHTVAVCNALKSAGVTPTWIQTGNENNNGMLWDNGKASLHMTDFVYMVNSGYNAAKSVFGSVKCIVHLANGYDNSVFRWIFDGMKNNTGKWDLCGMSLYPTTSNYTTLVSQCKTNMADMQSRYGKGSIMSEIGIDSAAGATGKAYVQAILNSNAQGVFYWEPEAYGTWAGYSMEAFLSNGRPSVIMDGFL